VIVDVGAGASSVAPVYECEVQLPRLKTVAFGGRDLDAAVQNALRLQGVELRPWESGGDGHISDNRQQLAVSRFVQDLKESICYCSPSPLAAVAPAPAFKHVLPDGQEVDVTPFSREVPETLLVGSATSSAFPGLPAMLAESLSANVEGGVSREVLLVGGSAQFVNFKIRLEAATSTKAKLKFAAHNRRHVAWLGGSVLAGSGALDSRWASRQDYEELGSSIFEPQSKR